MANLWALRKGDRAAAVTNYYTGETENIPLDVRLSPTANAQKYFKEYKKKQTAAKVLRQLIEESQAEVAYLETVLYEVGQAEGEAVSYTHLDVYKRQRYAYLPHELWP